MLYKQLKYFIAVVQAGSFTEAAERNFISQSAVSQQIKSLEEEVGVKLLERNNRGFTLTKAGEYMYGHGTALLAETDTLLEEARKIAEAESDSRIMIGFSKLYLGKELVNAIALFRQQYPDITIDVKSVGHEELFKGLCNGRFDFILEGMQGLYCGKEFEQVELGERNICIEISEQNPLSQKEHIDLEELTETPIILVVDKLRFTEEKAFYTSYFAEIYNNFVFAGDWGEARMLAAGGAGIVPEANQQNAFLQGVGLKCLPLFKDGVPLTYSLYLIHRKKKLNKAKKYFAALVAEQFAAGEN